eukprot:7880611-Ditylum_brightwellii.AAC.1
MLLYKLSSWKVRKCICPFPVAGSNQASDAMGFLGIELDRHEDGLLELKQTALIQRIIDTIGFQNASGKATPAE